MVELCLLRLGSVCAYDGVCEESALDASVSGVFGVTEISRPVCDRLLGVSCCCRPSLLQLLSRVAVHIRK